MSKRLLILYSLTLGSLIITGCSTKNDTPHENGYTYHAIYFGQGLSSDFKQGIRDGCETARGIYTKSHKRFNNNIDYYNGWFLGRNKCRHLLKVDENGDLIL
ncbi:MAG: hypothetical protein L3J47_01405 [Sulfurovum sp.]|nr:hypothetical protein [Sulfurovum sp.]